MATNEANVETLEEICLQENFDNATQLLDCDLSS